jgi:microcin C transport system permease protein
MCWSPSSIRGSVSPESITALLPSLNPLTRQKLQRFRSIPRGYYSFLLLAALLGAAAVGELLVNSRALVVRYRGHFYLPVGAAFHPGTDFGETYSYETNYRQLQERFRREHRGDWVLLPPVPYNPYENDFRPGVYPPTAPAWRDRHFLGTDTTGRDVLARLFYGFRTAMIFALLYMVFVYLIGIAVGCAMGYFGGTFDLIAQRLVEIWSNIPFLYIVIIVASILTPNLGLLLAIVVLFSWTGMTYYLRTITYRERTRDYVAAAEVLGAGTGRIIFHHILPNTLSTIVTFIPFTLASAITLLTALDFLGFGLPPPTPSWGELLHQGTANLNAPWIVTSTFAALVLVLSLVTFIGEAIREAFDPKKFTVYQ